MIKSNGLNKFKISIFISGTGSNLKNLINFSLKKNSKYKVVLIVSNNFKAKGLKYAKQFKIPKKIIQLKKINNSEDQIISILKKKKLK